MILNNRASTLSLPSPRGFSIVVPGELAKSKTGIKRITIEIKYGKYFFKDIFMIIIISH
jgi:hypothetical protein